MMEVGDCAAVDAVLAGDVLAASGDVLAGAAAMAGLLQALAADRIEWVRAEGLYTLDGRPGHS
jgi:hypothetical protein